MSRLPGTADEQGAVAGVLSVMRNVSQPFSTIASVEPDIWPTLYRSVADLTNGLYFYESTTSPNVSG